MIETDLDLFERAFFGCALWSSNDHDAEGEPPLDQDYSIEDIADETILKLKGDCDAFRQANRELLDAVTEQFGADESQHGHDFWLTRNGHGAGFWDRGYLDAGDKLSEAARAYGEVNLYVQDGKIYCE